MSLNPIGPQPDLRSCEAALRHSLRSRQAWKRTMMESMRGVYVGVRNISISLVLGAKKWTASAAVQSLSSVRAANLALSSRVKAAHSPVLGRNTTTV